MPEERNGFLSIPNGFFIRERIGVLKGRQIAVLITLAHYDYGKGSWPSRATIADHLQVSDVGAISETLRELAVIGFAQRTRKAVGGAEDNTSVWRVNWLPEASRVQAGLRWLASGSINWKSEEVADLFYAGELPPEEAKMSHRGGEKRPPLPKAPPGAQMAQRGGASAPQRRLGKKTVIPTQSAHWRAALLPMGGVGGLLTEVGDLGGVPVKMASVDDVCKELARIEAEDAEAAKEFPGVVALRLCVFLGMSPTAAGRARNRTDLNGSRILRTWAAVLADQTRTDKVATLAVRLGLASQKNRQTVKGGSRG